MPNTLFCPVCKTTYRDTMNAYCLNDGARLVSLNDDAAATPTVQMMLPTDSGRGENADSEPTVIVNSPAPAASPGSNRRWGLIIGVLIAGFLLIGGMIALAGAFFLFSGDNSNTAATKTPLPTSTPIIAISPTATNSANSNPSTQELEEKLRRLEKQLEAQKNQANKTNPFPGQTPNAAQPTAQVNSPNDGFLALRSTPSTESGSQILKIPHGATVSLNDCEKTTTKISGRNGRWCNVEYNGQNGWVFSAWLDY